MAKSRPLNLPQLAYAYKRGDLTADKMPERIRAKVKRFADSYPLDDLKAMSTHLPPTVTRQIGPIYAKLRQVRTA